MFSVILHIYLSHQNSFIYYSSRCVVGIVLLFLVLNRIKRLYTDKEEFRWFSPLKMKVGCMWFEVPALDSVMNQQH